MSRNDLDHHRVRVREELDRAYRATARAAIHAHFKLAALHMTRVAELVRVAHELGSVKASQVPRAWRSPRPPSAFWPAARNI
jgi:hypothetical protein